MINFRGGQVQIGHVAQANEKKKIFVIADVGDRSRKQQI